MEMELLPHQLKRQVDKNPRQIALIHKAVQFSYEDLWSHVVSIEAVLQAQGIVPGDRVVLVCENSLHYVAAYYGILACGAVVVPLNTALKAPQLTHLISHTQAAAVLYESHPEMNRVMADLADDNLPCLALSEVLEPATVARQNSISDRGQSAALTRDENDLASIIYTSGTTGQPKGVMLSHKNLVANTRSIVEYLALVDTDITMCVLPFFYSYGNSVLHTHLTVGATLILENSFLYPQKVLQTMDTVGVTGFAGVPSTYALLLSRCDLSKFPLPRLRFVTQAGGAMSPEAVREVAAYWPGAQFFVMYGQTEATARLTYLPPDRLTEKPGSVGKPIPGVEIAIKDDKGNNLPVGEQGEVCARGPNTMLGYWRNPDMTADKFYGDWLRTGDIGYLDADGYLTLVGRNSDMIKSGAHRIAPEEIEQEIIKLNGVYEVAVVGIPDPLLGQVIKAFVVTEDRQPIEKKQFMQHCKAHLAQYKWPKEIEYVEDLPKTASGKIRRHALLSE